MSMVMTGYLIHGFKFPKKHLILGKSHITISDLLVKNQERQGLETKSIILHFSKFNSRQNKVQLIVHNSS